MEKPSSIYRYMQFEHLLDLLSNYRLPLINPSYWEDKNDALSTKLSCKKDEIIGICCFTISGANSIYRWSKMAKNNLCVRVEFDRQLIENSLPDKIKLYEVQYKSKDDLDNGCLQSISDCAFLKSTPYVQEKEIRLVMRCTKDEKTNKKIVGYLEKLPTNTIKNIRFSPFLDREFFPLIRKYLQRQLDDCKWENVTISCSKILNMIKWKNSLRKAVKKLQENKK